ncbi:MAG: hypothetical protein KC646_04440 [Candidatus Cloacimonetes bacterium]|nr:hypothetical protein [Candidatus Cloacimonadota bacterium]
MKQFLFLFICAISFATNTTEHSHLLDTHSILLQLSNSLDLLQKEIKTKQKLLKSSKIVDEQKLITKDLAHLFKQLQKTSNKFEELATGIDISSFKNTTNQQIDISDEIHTLIYPIITVAKSATNDMREKAILLEEIDHYSSLLPKTKDAITNLQNQLAANKVSKKVDQRIYKLLSYWKKQKALIESQYKSSKHELINVEQSKLPLFQSIQNSIRDFLKTRGFYLFEAFFISICIILVSNLFHTLVLKKLPQFRKRPRSFQIRIIDLGFRSLGFLSAGLGPMLVFYIEEDWILFSMCLLVSFGLFWVFRNALPSLWQQAVLLLNIGAVREGERVIYRNMPWVIKEIHLYSKLENPTTGLTIRLPVSELITMISRKFAPSEPWFPCKTNDWVLLSNDTYGKVEGVSLEFVDVLVEGDSTQSFSIENFVGLNPINFSNSFAIKTIAGISYNHAQACNKKVLKTFKDFIIKKLEQSSYKNQFKSVVCEVHLLNSSSIDLAMIVNFEGTAAPQYRKLTRILQQWTLDACNQNDWQIPYPQLDIHTITE